MENGLDADQEPWPLSLACFDLRSISLDLSSLRMSGLDVETCKTHGSNYKGSEEHEEEGQFLCYHCPTHSDWGDTDQFSSNHYCQWTGGNSLNSFDRFSGRGPVFIIMAHFCSAVFWSRPSQEVEKYWKAALVVFLASLDTGNTEILGKNMFTYFSETVSLSLSLLELGGIMFTERFETSLKLLTHIRFLKIGSATTQAVPVIFQGPEKAACTPVPRGHEEGISGRQWARTGLCKISLRSEVYSGPHGWSIFVWAMIRLWNL